MIFVFNKYFLYYFMDFKEIKGIKHYLYDSLKEFKSFNPEKEFDETVNQVKIIASLRLKEVNNKGL